MLYVQGPGLEARSLSSASLYVLGPVVNLALVGRFCVESEYKPLLKASVSYSCGPGRSLERTPLRLDGLGGLPNLTDGMPLLVDIIPLRIASGSYV